LGLICAYITFVVFAWRDDSEFVIPVEEVARIDRANREARAEYMREAGR
jgi:cytochrome o ubiquinol oxidase subunit I